MTSRIGDWIQTYSGHRYYAHDPRAEDVSLEDIAHHLSLECRYTGACRWHYSVAQHSCYVHDILPPAHQLTGLLHDSTEAYTKDMAKPTKRGLADFQRMEEANWFVISAAFGLPVRLPQIVHDADWAVLLAEYKVLMQHPELPDFDYTLAADIEIKRWSPEQAEREFLQRYASLIAKNKYAAISATEVV